MFRSFICIGILATIGLVPLGCGRINPVQQEFDAVSVALNSKEGVKLDSTSLKNKQSPRFELHEKPWIIGEAPKVDSVTVWLDGYVAPNATIRSAVVSSAADRALVVYRPHQTRAERKISEAKDVALWINLSKKRVLSKIELPIPLTVFGIHQSGKMAILRGEPYKKPGLEELCLVDFSDDSSPTLKRWSPLLGSDTDGKKWGEGDSHLTWVDFVGDKSIATLNFRGDLHIWRIRGLNHFATYSDAIGLPTVTPDGRKLAVATTDGVALIDPMRRKSMGFQTIDDMPKEPTLAFHPNGHTLGITDDKKTIVCDLATRGCQTYYTTYLENGHYGGKPAVGWIGDYLCTGRSLTDVSAGIIVWKADGCKWRFPDRDALWAIVRDRHTKKRFALKAFPISSRSIARQIDPILRRSDSLPWHAGKSVRVEVDRLPSQQRAKAHEGLVASLKEMGCKAVAKSDLVLRASLGEIGKKRDVTYKMHCKGERWEEHVVYRPQPAILEIIYKGKTIWSTSQYHNAAMFITVWGESVRERLERIGQPDYGLYKRSLPSYVQSGNRKPLIETELYAN